ncbi:DUF4333 domain-containing protein [Pantanalinema sp. GBBB05]|uniref:DUF4333 domain-containing protein n=1 Tax=Pantanalinema sp. GBBB05 TaxID=2604139 RepID=UPI001D537218|nr:DUF4333 domain-containing protein [Pantanalinema sp. GBBB05]
MEQRSWFRRAVWATMLMLLPACEQPLAVTPIEASIQSDLKQRGQISVQAITCPPDVTSEVGKAFECVGELDPSEIFFITVTQEDDRGKVRWEVPSSWSLLNLNQLETEFEQKLKATTKVNLKVNCGGVYRPTKAGDSFSCQVVQLTTKGQSQSSDSILVKVEPEGKVTWQEIRMVAAKPTSIASSPSTSTPVLPNVAPSSAPSPVSSEVEPKDATGWTQLDD